MRKCVCLSFLYALSLQPIDLIFGKELVERMESNIGYFLSWNVPAGRATNDITQAKPRAKASVSISYDLLLGSAPEKKQLAHSIVVNMGLQCQINLLTPFDGTYSASSTVSGVIKYIVDEVTVFDKITVSLKGHGTLVVHDERNNDNYDTYTFTHREVYIDEDNVTKNEKKTPHEIGSYEKKFSFKLPDEIPSSLNYHGTNKRFRVRCNIIYYVRIKFEKPGFLQFAKRFKQELTVRSQIKPTLLNEPVIYGDQKKIFQLIPSKNGIVKMKATIKNSVLSPGGIIDLEIEIQNDTNVTVKGVKTKLIETYTFTTACGREIKILKGIDSTETKTSSIKSEEMKHFNIVLNVPADKASLGYSAIVSRVYFVRITAELPFPHTNIVLEIPVEICGVTQEIELGQDALEEVIQGPSNGDKPPPPYWIAMGEELKIGESNDAIS